MDVVSEYKNVRTGVTLIKVSITIIVVAILVGIGLGLLSIKAGSAALKGVALVAVTIFLAMLLAFVGKVFCVGTPVGKPIIFASLALDIVAGVVGRTSLGAAPLLSSLMSFASTGLFIYFLYVVGVAANLPDICQGAITTAKKGGVVLALCAGMVVLATLGPIAVMLGSVAFLVLGLSAFFSYLRLLDTVRFDLERGVAQTETHF